MNVWHKIDEKLKSLRLRPIRVLCLHQVSESYNPDVYCRPDWISLASFKERIAALLSEGYTFITLEDAFRYISKDIIRCRKYAVLTADDGLMCQLELLPWLEQMNIPITMFINVTTLDGKTCGEPINAYFGITDKVQEAKHAEALYCTKHDLWSLNSSILSVGVHGYSHADVSVMDEASFEEQLGKSLSIISTHPKYVSFYAYTFGRHTPTTDRLLLKRGVIPVLVDGRSNVDDKQQIHREIL